MYWQYCTKYQLVYEHSWVEGVYKEKNHIYFKIIKVINEQFNSKPKLRNLFKLNSFISGGAKQQSLFLSYVNKSTNNLIEKVAIKTEAKIFTFFFLRKILRLIINQSVNYEKL